MLLAESLFEMSSALRGRNGLRRGVFKNDRAAKWGVILHKLSSSPNPHAFFSVVNATRIARALIVNPRDSNCAMKPVAAIEDVSRFKTSYKCCALKSLQHEDDSLILYRSPDLSVVGAYLLIVFIVMRILASCQVEATCDYERMYTARRASYTIGT